MKDAFGNELNIGDSVVFVHGKNKSSNLEVGIVTKIYNSKYDTYECSVGNHAHILPFRVAKIDCLKTEVSTRNNRVIEKNKYQEALDKLSYPPYESDCGGCKCGESDCRDCYMKQSIKILQELIDKTVGKEEK